MEAIASGRLAKAASKTGGRWSIDSVTGREEWERLTDPSKRREGKPAGRPARRDPTGSLFKEDPSRAALDTARVSHASASRDVKLLDADLKRLELAERRGALVERADVQREAFALARTTRDRLLAVPERLAAPLAAETDPRKVQERLHAELSLVLEDLVEALAS